MKSKSQNHFWKNMRLWIITASLIVSIVPATIIAVLSFRSYESRMADGYLSEMQGDAHILSNRLSEGSFWEDQTEEQNELLVQYANMHDARAVVVDRYYRIVADTYGSDVNDTMISREVTNAFSGKESKNYFRDQGRATSAVPLYGSDGSSVMGVLWTSADVTLFDLVSQDVRQFVLMILIGIIVISALVIYFISIVLTHPIRKLEKQMDDAAHGLLDSELKVNTFNETRQMSESFNVLKKNYEVIDNSRREFVANVSHELKTPITSMKVLADSLLEQEGVPVELYQEFMHDIASQLDRETAIIDDLLALVKLDKRTGVLHLSDVNINEMLERLIKQLGPLANVNDLSVTFESHRNVTARVDEVKLSLACMNVLENAIKYNKPSGSVKVSLDLEEEQCVITIADTGIGIPQDELDKVFERFYRVDKSHAQKLGGSGLGLSIVRQAIEMQGGSVSAESQEGTGTIVTIKVPMSVEAVTEEGGRL